MEQPLLSYESCNLGSINLANMIKENSTGKFGFTFDFQKLSETVKDAVHFLDNVIDINNYPLEEIGINTRKTRKIGLGVMGWADLLTILGVPYNSKEALAIVDSIMSVFKSAAKITSNSIGQQRGTFPVYAEVSDKFNELNPDAEYSTPRNLYVTTIAPTGTISMIAGASSGIEPLFAVSYYKRCMDDTSFPEINPYFKEIAKSMGFYSDELMQKVIKAGTVAHIDEVPDDIKKIFVTAHEISPEWHIRMQAQFQKYIDNAISKTINFSNSATENDIRTAYLEAYNLKCKGITVYRDGSRLNQVLNMNETEEDKEVEPAILKKMERPEYIEGFTRKMAIGCGSLYITLNHDQDGNIFEVFTTLGKGGGCSSQSEAAARLASSMFQFGIPAEEVIKQLRGIKCGNCIRRPNLIGLSCPDCIARTIEEYINSIKSKIPKEEVKIFKPESHKKPIDSDAEIKNPCPECGAELRAESGCLTCLNCGWSRCS